MPSPSFNLDGKGASTGSGGGVGARGVGAFSFFFFFCDWVVAVTASETRRLAAGSRPARGGSLRFSAIGTNPSKKNPVDKKKEKKQVAGWDVGKR
ncbi:hypothetical protein VI817_009653 [Penicillium citrinum]|nr:hypothetical protein VI817_009653 [Penicillium citrinum]